MSLAGESGDYPSGIKRNWLNIPELFLEVDSWEIHRTTWGSWGVFQLSTFDYWRVFPSVHGEPVGGTKIFPTWMQIPKNLQCDETWLLQNLPTKGCLWRWKSRSIWMRDVPASRVWLAEGSANSNSFEGFQAAVDVQIKVGQCSPLWVRWATHDQRRTCQWFSKNCARSSHTLPDGWMDAALDDRRCIQYRYEQREREREIHTKHYTAYCRWRWD